MSYATATITGFLAEDPATRKAGDTTCTTVRLATAVSRKDSDGNRLEETTWWSCKIWGRRGELAQEYLAKGQPAIVTGTPVLREWEDNEGNKRFSLELRDADWAFVPARKSEGGTAHGAASRTVKPAGGTAGPRPAATSGDGEPPF